MAHAARKILWIDDEIEALRPHILYLNEKSYDVTPVSNGDDAISMIKTFRYDVILLDQMMPGQDGMSVLARVRELDSTIPLIMVTQCREDELINEALGKRISDFLVKPIGGAQIASTLKRVLDQTKIIEEQVPHKYTEDFNQIRLIKDSAPDWRNWAEIYLKLVEWDLEFDLLGETGLEETHLEQKKECNALFSDYVAENYTRWIRGEDAPVLSVDVLDRFVIPHLRKNKQVYFIVVDCLRLDHWLAIEPLLQPYYYIDQSCYYSILPSATLYSRNALFSGLFPLELSEKFPQYWLENSENQTSTNRFEKQLLQSKLRNAGLRLKPGLRYFKIFDAKGGNEYIRQVSSFERISLSALIVNFIDILTHQRSQLDVLQQIAPDESAFRSLAKSWFAHSALFEILKIISPRDAVVVLTTDHGSVLGNRPTKAFGNRQTSTSLRFKVGTDLACDEGQAVYIKQPNSYKLPAESSNKNYIIAKDDYYFVYPNQFHEYTRQFRGGFQHGGISMGELIVPVVTMTSR
jgi:DNA-binding response OmpR family regulator